uniref:Hydroxyethylthiazole kinase n=1 Tax=Caenorhabditis tropicalis TaxID=1561998 RepID=A0A1I7V4K0_9PELO
LINRIGRVNADKTAECGLSCTTPTMEELSTHIIQAKQSRNL